MDDVTKVTIDVRNVIKRYGDFTALQKISMSISDNEFFTLLGPSGCGKTTLLRMIAGFEDVTEGNIFLSGEEIASLPPNFATSKYSVSKLCSFSTYDGT